MGGSSADVTAEARARSVNERKRRRGARFDEPGAAAEPEGVAISRPELSEELVPLPPLHEKVEKEHAKDASKRINLASALPSALLLSVLDAKHTVCAIAFSNDCSMAACGCSDSAIRIYFLRYVVKRVLGKVHVALRHIRTWHSTRCIDMKPSVRHVPRSPSSVSLAQQPPHLLWRAGRSRRLARKARGPHQRQPQAKLQLKAVPARQPLHSPR